MCFQEEMRKYPIIKYSYLELCQFLGARKYMVDRGWEDQWISQDQDEWGSFQGKQVYHF